MLYQSREMAYCNKVGIVKFYDKELGIGRVLGFNDAETFMGYIIDYNLPFKAGDIIIFDRDELLFQNHTRENATCDFYYCYNISYISDKADAIEKIMMRDIDKRYKHFESFAKETHLICYSCRRFVDFALINEIKPFQNLLNNIASYIDNFDFDKVLNDYEVKLHISGHSMVGDREDVVRVEIRSSSLKNVSYEDLYIREDLLPNIVDTILERSEYTPYQKMLKEIGDYTEHEIYAEHLNDYIKVRAKTYYSKATHHTQLRSLLLKKIEAIKRDYENVAINSSKKMIVKCLTTPLVEGPDYPSFDSYYSSK